MRKIILRDRRPIPPFNEPARELRVMNKPLWLFQRDVLARYTTVEREVDSLEEIEPQRVETLIYRDNLFFDQPFIDTFIKRARRLGKACRVAFALNDRAISTYCLQLQRGIKRQRDHYVADMWYFPYGLEPNVRPLVMDTESREVGYYHVPTHMSSERGDLIYNLPTKAFISIEHWTQIITANVPFGIFAEGARLEKALEHDLGLTLRLLWRALLERKQLLTTSALVHVGRNCSIDPSAVIQGPTFIGDNVAIGPGVVIGNSLIGNNVTLAQGCQLMLSVVSDRCFLPFRASLFMSVLMEDCMVAQNTCLQLACLGRNSFVGAGTTFTDFNLIPKSLRARFQGELEDARTPVLGGCVGHNCRIGSGLVIFPARMIDSDTVLSSQNRHVIVKDVMWEESDHLKYADGLKFHPRMYPRQTPQSEVDGDG